MWKFFFSFLCYLNPLLRERGHGTIKGLFCLRLVLWKLLYGECCSLSCASCTLYFGREGVVQLRG